MTKKTTIAAFDFDGTITKRDAFLPFLIRAFGGRRVLIAFSKLTFEGINVLLGISNRDRFKELLVAELFKGESIDRLTALGMQHGSVILNWIRPLVRERIEWHRTHGHRLILVSASLDLYLIPVAAALGFNDLLCTRLSMTNLLFDGKLQGLNCRGPEKVRQLEYLLGSLSQYEIHAYGDSAGDKEMLGVATFSYYKHF